MKNLDGSSSTRFLCSSEWHLSRSNSFFAAVIYGFALKITKPIVPAPGSKPDPNADQKRRFFVSIPSMAEYFGADERTVRRTVHKLEREGFFVKLKEVPGESVSYRPVLHKEWAHKNPKCCLDYEEMPWADEAKDELAIWLFTASDGSMKCFPNFMRGLRKLGHSDDALREHFGAFYADDIPEKKGRFKRFMAYLRPLPVSESDRPAELVEEVTAQ